MRRNKNCSFSIVWANAEYRLIPSTHALASSSLSHRRIAWTQDREEAKKCCRIGIDNEAIVCFISLCFQRVFALILIKRIAFPSRHSTSNKSMATSQFRTVRRIDFASPLHIKLNSFRHVPRNLMIFRHAKEEITTANRFCRQTNVFHAETGTSTENNVRCIAQFSQSHFVIPNLIRSNLEFERNNSAVIRVKHSLFRSFSVAR